MGDHGHCITDQGQYHPLVIKTSSQTLKFQIVLFISGTPRRCPDGPARQFANQFFHNRKKKKEKKRQSPTNAMLNP